MQPAIDQLPGASVRGNNQHEYDSNDIAAYYLYHHWRENFNGWRKSPINRLIIYATYPNYSMQSVRYIFRRILAEWYLEQEMSDRAKIVLDNCFGHVFKYKPWAETTVAPDSQVYKYKFNPIVYEYLPEHTHLI